MIDLEALVPLPEPMSTVVYPASYGRLYTAEQMTAFRQQVAREVAQACSDMCDSPEDAARIAAEFGLEKP